MDTRLRQHGRSVITWLLLALLLNLAMTATVVFADRWRANDDGNDDPDGEQWWFAPFSLQHQLAWWDIDQFGAMDQVLDHHMQWRNDVQLWFQNQPDRNLCHEVRTDVEYEAEDWYWTDLPEPDHNEDSNEVEEWKDGYEEKEIGWDDPATQIPGGVERMVYTGYVSFDPIIDAETYFESESELTKPSPYTGDPWFPDAWDYLGRIDCQEIRLEVEGFHQRIPRSGHNWEFRNWSGKPGWLGWGAMQALPKDPHVNINTGYTTSSPELRYYVDLPVAGTYYVWIRGWGNNGQEDSVHAGIDGQGPSSADRISGCGWNSPGWKWCNSTMDGPRATIYVSSGGTHTFNLWMRENGFRADMVLLTQNPNYTP
jgi:hypothetical protein